MSESEKDGGWEEFGGDDVEEDAGALIPEGREMTLEEQNNFLARLFVGSITGRYSPHQLGGLGGA